MGLINADQFLQIVESYRLLWICGRPAGGKTSLAYKISETWLKRGYRLITNNQSVWADDIKGIGLGEDNMLHCVVLLDEGGLEFKASRQIESIASYAAKMDCIYLIPSFWAPTRAAQVVVCQPLFSFKGIGVPLVVYKWRVRLAGFEDRGHFLWWSPGEVYGIYSRQDPGGRAGEIISFLVDAQAEFRRRFGRGEEEDGLPELETKAEDLLQDAINEFSDSVDRVVSIPLRKTGKRRF